MLSPISSCPMNLIELSIENSTPTVTTILGSSGCPTCDAQCVMHHAMQPRAKHHSCELALYNHPDFTSKAMDCVVEQTVVVSTGSLRL